MKLSPLKIMYLVYGCIFQDQNRHIKKLIVIVRNLEALEDYYISRLVIGILLHKKPITLVDGRGFLEIRF